MTTYLHDLYEYGVVSDCCGASVYLGDMCADCKEHCTPITEEEHNPSYDYTPQEQRIIDYLRNHGKINPLQAWKECGVYRLSAVIFNLKKKNIDIQSDRVKVQNKFDEDCNVAEYKLVW